MKLIDVKVDKQISQNN